MPKFTSIERLNLQNIVANLTIKRIPENEIIKEVYNQTGKTISRRTLCNVKQRIKRDSFKWYKTLREGEYEYIHEFKERINEIVDLQKRHHEIIDSTKESTVNKQSSLAELHRLNITLSNYFEESMTMAGFGAELSENPPASNVI